MEKQPAPQMLNRDGRPVRVKKVPMSTGRKKFKSRTPYDPTMSPFKQFAASNETKGGIKSY